ncbi:MAG: hypothetical protein PUA49_01400 [Butyrivibrio sp.]|nr:hypothetical protein [Butyrivibrio sp.]
MSEKYIVDGYQFTNQKDYDDAKNEKKGIKYLTAQIDWNDSNRVRQLYCDLCEQKIFRTPIGIDFMKKMRANLTKSAEGDKPLPYVCVPSVNAEEYEKAVKIETKKREDSIKEMNRANSKLRGKLKTAVFLNILLIVVIIFMFILANTSSNPNIINYERKIQDKYAKWAEELKDKENELRARENALEKNSAISQN